MFVLFKRVYLKAGIVRNRQRLLSYACFKGNKQLECTALGFALKHKFSLLDGPKNVSFVTNLKRLFEFRTQLYYTYMPRLSENTSSIPYSYGK